MAHKTVTTERVMSQRQRRSSLRAYWVERFKEQLVAYVSTLNIKTVQEISKQKLYARNYNHVNSFQLRQVTYIWANS